MFLLGLWKNYQELEDNLTLDELMITLDAIRKKESNERVFLAALQGVDLNKDQDQEDADNDITGLVGMSAAEAGFGIGAGLGYMTVGG